MKGSANALALALGSIESGTAKVSAASAVARITGGNSVACALGACMRAALLMGLAPWLETGPTMP
jgi:hypothetical protein